MTGSETEHQARIRSPHPTTIKIRRMLWALVEGTAFRWSFHTWNRWRSFLLRAFGARIGAQCIIRRTVKVYYPWNLRVGDLCIVGDDASLYSLGTITLGDHVMVSQEAYLCAGTHDHTQLSLPLLTPPIEVENNAWICARAFVGPGIRIGAGSLVAAAAVVVKDVEPWTMVGGNPARFIKKRELRSVTNTQA